MSLVKERMIKIIQEQPDDSDYSEILKELSFSFMVNRGILNSENNKITSHEDFLKEIDAW